MKKKKKKICLQNFDNIAADKWQMEMYSSIFKWISRAASADNYLPWTNT